MAAKRNPIHSAPIEHFDFARVARAMKILRWHWAENRERTPSESELIAEAQHLLRSARENSNASTHEYHTVSSGGLVAHYDGVIDFESLSYGRQLALAAWEKAKQ